MIYTLERSQELDAPIETVWRFIATPRNLNRITPPDLHFEIVGEVPETMYGGLLIEYRLTIPVFGRRRWVSEIKHIREGGGFVDEQRVGPYKLWYHEHHLEECAGGRTRMTDRVTYVLPFGPVGGLTHRWIVRGQLERIFDHRAAALAELFAG
jgi:ligand-binding SRPBCC domain-containing protein